MTIEVANTPLKRMKGLLGRTSMPHGHGLLITPCNAVHTLGMRFAIDLRFFNKAGILIRTYRNVPPGCWWRGGGLKAYAVLETLAGDATFDDVDILTQIKKEYFYV
jgi:uncharacterized membrane protein (UPF0127 family)